MLKPRGGALEVVVEEEGGSEEEGGPEDQSLVAALQQAAPYLFHGRGPFHVLYHVPYLFPFPEPEALAAHHRYVYSPSNKIQTKVR